MQIQTDRLLLRPWRAADREPFAELNADPVVMEHFPATLSRVDSDAFADRIMARFAAVGWGLWAVEVPGGPPFLGYVGLAPVPADVPVRADIEIGWRLAVSGWGHGYATEAARAVVGVARDELALSELISFTARSNIHSQAVMQRIGMRPDGEFEHPRLPVGHPLRPHVLYRLP